MADIKDVLVPDLGEDSVEVIEICVAVGDSVEAEDALVTVESDKASMDIPVPFAGKVSELTVKVGDKISEGDLLAKLEVAGDADSAPAAEEKPAEGGEDPAARIWGIPGEGEDGARRRRVDRLPGHPVSAGKDLLDG